MMPIYAFKCDCGRCVDEMFEPSDLKQVTCRCGAQMYRDYSGIGIGGDLPSKWRGFDFGLGQHVDDKADRDRKMQAMGLSEFTPDPEQQKYRKEMRYITAHGRGRDAPEAAKKIVELKRESGRLRRKRVNDRIRAERRKASTT